MSEEKKSIIKDKILGMVIGGSLSDALGAPHEFYYQNKKYTGKLEHQARISSQFQGNRYCAIGQFTDDTEMTLIILRSLVKNKGEYKREEVIQNYIDWANDHTVFLGKNTRYLFKGHKTIKTYQKRYNALSVQETQSNGALMRCSPLFILDIETALQDCKITNPNPVTVETNRFYLSLLKNIFANPTWSKRKLMKDIILPELKEVRDVVEPIVTSFLNKKELEKREMDNHVNSKKGWCLVALHLSLTTFLFFDNYKDGIGYIINLKGDTDTNGAIYGWLYGAFHGYEKLKSEDHITEENIKTLLRCDTNLGDFPRKSEYTLHDIFTLTDKFSNLVKV